MLLRVPLAEMACLLLESLLYMVIQEELPPFCGCVPLHPQHYPPCLPHAGVESKAL